MSSTLPLEEEETKVLVAFWVSKIAELEKRQLALGEEIAKFRGKIETAGGHGAKRSNAKSPKKRGERQPFTVVKDKTEDLLKGFANSVGGTELVRRLGFPASSVYRALGELKREGKVTNKERKWAWKKAA